MRKKRVLMVANYYPNTGGIEASLVALADLLREQNYEVDIHDVGNKLYTRPLKYLRLIFRIRTYDIVHSHGSSGVGFIPALIATVAGWIWRKKTVVTYHGSVQGNDTFIRHGHVIRVVAKLAGFITTPFGGTGTSFELFGRKAYEIPNILNASVWRFQHKDTIKPKLLWTRSSYSPEFLIEMFTELKRKLPEATLTMCGLKAGYVQQLSEEYQGKGLTLLGKIQHDELGKIINQHDILINNVGIDSFGYSIYEAAASGLAVASVESPSLRYYIGDAINFSAESTPISLAETVYSLVKNQEITLRKIDIGRNLIKNFDSTQVWTKWKEIYEK